MYVYTHRSVLLSSFRSQRNFFQQWVVVNDETQHLSKMPSISSTQYPALDGSCMSKDKEKWRVDKI